MRPRCVQIVPVVLIGALSATCATAPAAHPGLEAFSPPREWRARLAEGDGTELDLRLTLIVHPSGSWELHSRPGAALTLIPWHQRVAGRILRRLPPRGSLLHARGTVALNTASQAGDTVHIRGVLESPFLGRRHLTGTLAERSLRFELRRGSDSGTVAGTIAAAPDTSSQPYRDYPAIARAARRAATDLVFDPRVAERRAFGDAFDDFDRAASRAHDDLDMVAGFLAIRARLGTSHFGFIRNPRIAAAPLDSLLAGDPSVDPKKLVGLHLPATGLAVLRVIKWDRVGPSMDRAFSIIDSIGARVLILDIRGNTGGDASSMVAITHLVRDTAPVGVFVGRNWYADHDRPPLLSEYSSFPSITSERAAAEMFRHILTDRGVVGRAPPRARRFDGRVIVLVDRRTASASEPLVHFLREGSYATIIGERTAGRMLTALPASVGAGFIMTVPQADYFAADGTRLEGRGVEPHIRTPSADAAVRAAIEVRPLLPFAGTVWLGDAYYGLRKYADARTAWLEARPLARTPAEHKAIESRLALIGPAAGTRTP